MAAHCLFCDLRGKLAPQLTGEITRLQPPQKRKLDTHIHQAGKRGLCSWGDTAQERGSAGSGDLAADRPSVASAELGLQGAAVGSKVQNTACPDPVTRPEIPPSAPARL